MKQLTDNPTRDETTDRFRLKVKCKKKIYKNKKKQKNKNLKKNKKNKNKKKLSDWFEQCLPIVPTLFFIKFIPKKKKSDSFNK